MKRILILGGGFGGLPAAHRLRELLGDEAEIVVVERRDHFMLGLRKSWALVGQAGLEDGRRPLANLEQHGIRWVHGELQALDPEARRATVNGQTLEADAFIVALGAELDPDRVPGFREHAFNVYDPVDVPRAAEALKNFKGGRVVVGIFGAPYKCPPGPYEMSLLVRDYLGAKGVDASVEVFTPQPMSLPVLGQVGCDLIESRLAENRVTFLPNHKAVRVEPGQVVFGTGPRGFDLLLGVPPHRCPPVIVEAGLTVGSDWVRVNARTLETAFENVYAVGDIVEIPLANGKPLPKAGVFAEAMGRVAAERIAATLRGSAPTARFAGEGGCFLEVGQGKALMVTGNFLAEPAPEVLLTEPSAQYLEEKRSFEAERLKAWLE